MKFLDLLILLLQPPTKPASPLAPLLGLNSSRVPSDVQTFQLAAFPRRPWEVLQLVLRQVQDLLEVTMKTGGFHGIFVQASMENAEKLTNINVDYIQLVDFVHWGKMVTYFWWDMMGSWIKYLIFTELVTGIWLRYKISWIQHLLENGTNKKLDATSTCQNKNGMMSRL